MRLGDHGCEVTDATEHLKIDGFKLGVGSGISGSQFPEPLILCSPISSPTSRGFCTMKRRRFNDLGEMKACLQSRCSPS
jgi:hypothetical protein